jgi:ribosomal protein L17
MRHRVKKIKLSRDFDHSRSLVRNLTKSFFLHGKIESTKPKILSAQKKVERLISKTKKNELMGKKALFALFQNQQKVNQLVSDIFSQIDKSSGFTKVIRMRIRKGDNSVIYALMYSSQVNMEKGKKEKKEAKKNSKQANKKTKTADKNKNSDNKKK